MRLIPTDEHFYTLLEQLAERLTAAGRLLEELFTEPTRASELMDAIRALEHEADQITYEISERIDRSIITPMDREDVHRLATKLDDVVDLIDETAHRVVLFHITTIPIAARQLAGTVRRAGEHLEAAVGQLRTGNVGGAFAEHIQAVKREEEAGDAIYMEAVGELFAAPTDALHLIKWKEIYDKLEDATDECQHAAQVVQSAALKHA